MPGRNGAKSIDDGHEDAPSIAAAVDQSEVGSPALVGMVGDGAGVFHPRTASNDSLWKGPSFELHEAMDLLAVDVEAIAEAQTAPGAAHAAGGLGLMELLDACGEGFVNGAGFSLPGLVVGGGARQSEPRAEAGDGDVVARREEDDLIPQEVATFQLLNAGPLFLPPGLSSPCDAVLFLKIGKSCIVIRLARHGAWMPYTTIEVALADQCFVAPRPTDFSQRSPRAGDWRRAFPTRSGRHR